MVQREERLRLHRRYRDPEQIEHWGLKENYLDDGTVKFRTVEDYLRASRGIQPILTRMAVSIGRTTKVGGGLFGSNSGNMIADGNGSSTTDAADYVMWRQIRSSLVPGDFNADGTVDAKDYQLWASSFGSTTSLNGDGNNSVAGAADLLTWRKQESAQNAPFGGASLTAALIPEPYALMLFLEATIVCLNWRATNNL